MPARGNVQIGALLRHRPLSGAWPPPTRPWMRHRPLDRGQAFVGAGHARESECSDRGASAASTAFGGLAPSYKAVDAPSNVGTRPGFCRSGPCPRERMFRSGRFCGINRFRGLGTRLRDRRVDCIPGGTPPSQPLHPKSDRLRDAITCYRARHALRACRVQHVRHGCRDHPHLRWPSPCRELRHPPSA